jgi:hypothetical protein
MEMNIQLQLLNNELKQWVLLDTGSTVHVFCNKLLVKNIQNVPEQLHIKMNAGTLQCHQKTNLPWNGMEVWFDPTSIANILRFGLLQSQYKIKYDNNVSNTFFVETEKRVLTFERLTNQLYVFNPTTHTPILTNLLNTLAENKQFHMK